MIRPFGKPPIPRAISRPIEPVETDSISITGLFCPNFIMEPFPKLRSICDSADSRAFSLSISCLSAILCTVAISIPYVICSRN